MKFGHADGLRRTRQPTQEPLQGPRKSTTRLRIGMGRRLPLSTNVPRAYRQVRRRAQHGPRQQPACRPRTRGNPAHPGWRYSLAGAHIEKCVWSSTYLRSTRRALSYCGRSIGGLTNDTQLAKGTNSPTCRGHLQGRAPSRDTSRSLTASQMARMTVEEQQMWRQLKQA
jgi:hypothetical protein